jgi:phosphatidylinositol alpha-1,6-mannosyltransferase
MTCILAIVTDAYGGYGGIAQYNRDLVSALAECGAAQSIDVLPRYAPDEVGRLPEKVRQHRPVRARGALSLAAIGLARRLRPDIVFCGHLHLSPLAAWIARRHNAALVCQAHGLEFWTRPPGMRRRAMEAADLVLCVSRDTRAQVLNWIDLPPERVRVAPNTVDQAFTPADGAETRRRLGLTGRKVVLSVSRLDSGQRHKGQDRIIRLLPDLIAQGLDVVYLIAGEGDDVSRLRAMAEKLGLTERVRFLGRVAQAHLPELYRTADLFALPSTGDGFGIVFLEAMACGTPALALAAGGSADALADGKLGILTDETGLAAALTQALQTAARPTPAEIQRRFGRSAFRARAGAIFGSVALAKNSASRHKTAP